MKLVEAQSDKKAECSQIGWRHLACVQAMTLYCGCRSSRTIYVGKCTTWCLATRHLRHLSSFKGHKSPVGTCSLMRRRTKINNVFRLYIFLGIVLPLLGFVNTCDKLCIILPSIGNYVSTLVIGPVVSCHICVGSSCTDYLNEGRTHPSAVLMSALPAEPPRQQRQNVAGR
jgi:hypothetical protein